MAKNKTGSINAAVQDEIYSGLLPAMKNDRIFNFSDMFLVCAGLGIATWCYVQGGMLGYYLDLKDIFFNVFFAITFGGIIVSLLCVIGTRYGIDTVIYLRSVFGHRGIATVFLITFFCTWGYEAINCQMFGNSMVRLGNAFNIPLGDNLSPYIALICCWIGWAIALGGPQTVKKVNKVLVPIMIFVGLLIILLVFRVTSWAELTSMTAVGRYDYGTARQTYMINLEWNFAFAISWVNAIGSLPKMNRSEKGSYWGFVLGACFIMALFIFIGALTGLVMAQSTGVISSDPTEWLVTLGSPLISSLALVMIGFANISTQSVVAYVVSLSTKGLLTKIPYKAIITFWSIYCSILILWGGIWTYYGTFVSVVGAVSAPIAGIYIVDYFFIRRQKVSLYSMFRVKGHCSYDYSNGFNLVAFTAMVIGILSFVLVYNPITYEANSPLFFITTATGLALIVGGASYYLLCLIPSLRKYVLADTTSNDVLVYVRDKNAAETPSV